MNTSDDILKAISLSIEAIAKANQAQVELNERFLTMLEKRDAGWRRLHDMDVELREMVHPFDVKSTRRRAELLALAGDSAIESRAVAMSGDYDTASIIRKISKEADDVADSK